MFSLCYLQQAKVRIFLILRQPFLCYFHPNHFLGRQRKKILTEIEYGRSLFLALVDLAQWNFTLENTCHIRMRKKGVSQNILLISLTASQLVPSS